MIKEIYLAGGCFWGTQEYLSQLTGVIETSVGYANGDTVNPTYEEVCRTDTGFAETVKVVFDDTVIGLPFILDMYYQTINPTTVNRQGGDIGSQYRTGIYFINEDDVAIIKTSIAQLQKAHDLPIAIEVRPLSNYYLAEEYHQNYLKKNPDGYCHIGKDKFEQARKSIDISKISDKVEKAEKTEMVERDFQRKDQAVLKQELTQLQYEVTQNSATEAPFQNEYYDNFKEGIYIDITTGEPLFVSSDKFDSGCGWPSFSKPIRKELIVEKEDSSLARVRTEVRSSQGDSHLGHVFNDGPDELGGLRYCINSAALRFISKDDMVAQGYEAYLPLVRSRGK